MWIAIASMLATFDFLKAQDDNGNELDFSPKFTRGATSCVPVLSLHESYSWSDDRQTTQTLPVPNCSPDVSECNERTGYERYLISFFRSLHMMSPRSHVFQVQGLWAVDYESRR